MGNVIQTFLLFDPQDAAESLVSGEPLLGNFDLYGGFLSETSGFNVGFNFPNYLISKAFHFFYVCAMVVTPIFPAYPMMVISNCNGKIELSGSIG